MSNQPLKTGTATSSTSLQASQRSIFSEPRFLYGLGLAWRNARSQAVQSVIAVFVVAFAIALFVTVMVLNDGLRRGIIQASDPFGVLVIGAKGSSQQLVLSTILLQELPVGNIPYVLFEKLQQDPRVALAVPMAMGDNVGGARIIGTSSKFFTLSPSPGEPPTFQLQAGRLFEADFEAVLGSNAANLLGLKIGQAFNPAHGVQLGLESDVHDLPHRVVGILQPSNSPYDNAAFTTIESVWAVHDEHAGKQYIDAKLKPPSVLDLANDHTTTSAMVTAVLVRPTGFIEANQIWRELQLGTEAQAAFPGKELGELFDLLGQGQRLLTIVGYFAAGMAALTVLLAIYSATVAREQSIAIMRSLGASRLTIFRIVIFEALLITVSGSLVGRLIGYGGAAMIATRLSQQSAIPISIKCLPEIELWLWAITFGLGVVGGLIPAILAYRVNVVEKLFPT